MVRTKIVAGNWKMNKTPSEAKEFAEGLKKTILNSNAEVIVGVPTICLCGVKETIEGSLIKVAAQNMHWELNGAFTGEISGQMLKDVEITHVIIGHSERRQFFAETDESVNKKVKSALRNELIPIICVGEALIEREQGITEEVIKRQVKIALMGISENDMTNIVIAYEPVWAIGTGKTATSNQADEVCKIIRDTIQMLYSTETANCIRILYGGSVTASNSKELFAMPNIDGGLIGGASLKSEEFMQIVSAAQD